MKQERRKTEQTADGAIVVICKEFDKDEDVVVISSTDYVKFMNAHEKLRLCANAACFTRDLCPTHFALDLALSDLGDLMDGMEKRDARVKKKKTRNKNPS